VYVTRKQPDIDPHQAAEHLVATLDRIARTGAVAPDASDRAGLYAERMATLERGRP